jgi:2-oxoglutarate dehydrogenase E2 component (dihydrolipoamide succinyltransferase)
MIYEIKAPSPGESITQVMIASWLVEDGTAVGLDAEIAEIESDKATLTVFAPAAGVVHIDTAAGETVEVGHVIARIDTEETSKLSAAPKVIVKAEESLKPQEKPVSLSITPLAKKLADLEHIPAEKLQQIKKEKITRTDVQNLLQSASAKGGAESRPERRLRMSPLRIKLSERLVAVKNETAMLTTFNEVDMTEIIAIRKQIGEQYKAQHGHNISYISFFALAAVKAFAEFPQINASIDGEDIVYHDYCDLCIAVSTPKGLLAPAIRDVQKMSVEEVDAAIHDFGTRAMNNKITLEELRGGTFTITNGGTFGSLFSTPLINPPQSAILGMHKIKDRPVAVNGKVEIRPMMYIALSYDHRLIDGKESVGFIVKVKEALENPKLLLKNPSEGFGGFLK